MKFSNRLLLFLAGVVFVLLGLFLFTNPVASLVAYSWWIAFGLLVSSIAAILGYFSAPKELRSPVYLFQGFVSLLLALYLVAYGFLTLPVVIPTIVGIWLIVEAIIAFFKGNRLGLIFPIIGSNIMWVQVPSSALFFYSKKETDTVSFFSVLMTQKTSDNGKSSMWFHYRNEFRLLSYIPAFSDKNKDLHISHRQLLFSFWH